MRISKYVTICLFILFNFLISTGQDGTTYKTPPKDIADLVLAKPTPSAIIDGKAEWMLLLERSDFPGIEDLAKPELRIAGLRINPNNYSPTRTGSFNAISIKNIKSGKLFQIDGLPKDLRATNVQWSPDESGFALIHNGSAQLDLYVVNLADKKAKKINSNGLNTVLGGSYQWAGNNSLMYKTIVAGKKLNERQAAPSGPIAQENIGKSAASRTYQDLIRSAYDESLFEHYGTAQLVSSDLSSETPIGLPGLYRSISVSPDNKFILATTVNTPFSYLVPAQGFPHTVKVMDMTGRVIRELATNPSSEGQPIGFDDAAFFPRGFNWRDDKPSTVIYVQAVDKGLGKSKSEYRDAVYALDVAGDGQPKELFKTKRRFGGITWGNDDVAVFYERTNTDRKVRMNRYNPSTGKVDSLFERSSNDAYSDIGTAMTEKNNYGQQTLILLNGKELLLRSQGASAEGDMPLIQTFDITNGKKNVLWRSQAPYYENVVEVIDAKKGIFLTSRENPTEAANYYIRNLNSKAAPVAITDFKNPYAGLEGVKKEKISYQRADGINLTGNLYLPKGFEPRKDKPLPVVIWAYPIEYKSAADAAQVRGSKYTFTRINYGSPIFWVTQGYAVLDAAEMPIVGEGGKQPTSSLT